MSCTPPYQITDHILLLVAHISERVGTITERTRTEAKPHLCRNNWIRSVHASLAIEANSLSLDDVRDIIDGRTVVGSRKEIREVQNAYAAYEQIGSFDVYRVADLSKAGSSDARMRTAPPLHNAMWMAAARRLSSLY